MAYGLVSLVARTCCIFYYLKSVEISPGFSVSCYHSREIRIYVCMYVCMYVCTYYIRTYVYTYIYVCVCMYACMYVCMYICMYLYMCIHVFHFQTYNIFLPFIFFSLQSLFPSVLLLNAVSCHFVCLFQLFTLPFFLPSSRHMS